jgi:hypothetical protein
MSTIIVLEGCSGPDDKGVHPCSCEREIVISFSERVFPPGELNILFGKNISF